MEGNFPLFVNALNNMKLRILSFFKLAISLIGPLKNYQDELETHSETGSISIFVHYGGGRAHNPKEIAEHDVVLTTYGVLSNAYKSVRMCSLYIVLGQSFPLNFNYLFSVE